MQKGDPRSLGALALFGAALVSASGQTLGAAGPLDHRLLDFAVFTGRMTALPLFFFAAGWAAWQAQTLSGGRAFLTGVLGSGIAAIGWTTLLSSPLLFMPQTRPWLAEIGSTILLLTVLGLAAAGFQRLNAGRTAARVLERVAARPGGLLLCSIPVALTVATINDGNDFTLVAGLRPHYSVVVLYSTFFLAGWWTAASPERIAQMTRRWRFRLIVAFVLSLLLHTIQVRRNVGLSHHFAQRALFSLNSVLFTWRAILALTGAYRAFNFRISGALLRLAEAGFCCYCILGPYSSWLGERFASAPVPIPLQLAAVTVSAVAIGWSSYELLARTTGLRKWLAWFPPVGTAREPHSPTP